ncbi:MAG TPA: cyclic nucleotide-binding domain-containing protein [Roseiflexaceae bacterium]|nr:cyclic nucleotide-binding domain-containing protein [Roseiflexaceae bacterium]
MGNSEPTAGGAPIVPDSSALQQDPAFIEFAQQVFSGSEIADGLTPDQLARLAAIGQMRAYDSGDLICDEHERSDELYIVGGGAVEVWLDPASIGDETSAPRKIASLQMGQTCGELALLDGGVRSARLRAGPHGARLMAFTRDNLLALCDADTAIGYRLMRNLAGALALRLRLQDMQLYSIE